MIVVIGISYSTEYLCKGLYENTVGRLTEWISSPGSWRPQTAEDRYIQAFAQEYATFIHATPWYEFPFAPKLREFWTSGESAKGNMLRRWERRVAFTLELLFKTAWGWVIKQGSQAAYDPEELVIQVWVRDAEKPNMPGIQHYEQVDAHSALLALPRYEPFTQAVTSLATQGVQFIEIAGNTKILMTIIAPSEWKDTHNRGEVLQEWTILTQPHLKRVAMTVAVEQLHEVLPSFLSEGVKIDHLYDF